jgi:hypothetical protein
MKLSPHLKHIEDAFAALMSSFDDLHPIDDYHCPVQGRRIRLDLPRGRRNSEVPRIVPTYPPQESPIPLRNKERLLLLGAFQATYHNSPTPISPDMVPIVIDTGASITVTPYITDFTTPIKPVQQMEIKGIASGLQVCGYGDISYSFYNDSGELQTMTLKNCLYVPKCTIRLLCPRQLGATSRNPKDGFNALSGPSILTFEGKATTITYDTISNLPILYTAPGIRTYHRFCQQQSFLTTLDHNPDKPSWNFQYTNLTPNQHKKLHLHEKCAHANWDQMNKWIRDGQLPCDPSLANEPDPMCATCQFGKAHRKTHKGNTGNISADHTKPGQGVSSDGMEAGTPGRVMTTHGIPLTKKYRYCSFWIDHFSKFVYVTMHESKKAEELLRSKQEFEAFAARHGITISNIRADNGVYTAKLFQDDCLKKQQRLTFCAVGAHWQNGIAECFIGSIVQRARTILLHAMARWPSVITEDMWPFAVQHMVNFHNVSDLRGKSTRPYTLFTGQDPLWSFNDFKVFGCPSFVLAKRLQDGDGYNKWKSRCWQGAYIGNSTCHAGHIPLIYNPTTTHVTPQYHVTFDEGFTTVQPHSSAIHDTILQKLYHKAQWSHSSEFATTEDLYYFDTLWMDPPLAPRPEGHGRKRKHNSTQAPPLTTSEGAQNLAPVAYLLPRELNHILSQGFQTRHPETIEFLRELQIQHQN